MTLSDHSDVKPKLLRSASSSALVVPATRRSSLGDGDGAFVVAGPRAMSCMEQFTSVRHRLLVTSHLQEMSQDLFIQLIFLEHESD